MIRLYREFSQRSKQIGCGSSHAAFGSCGALEKIGPTDLSHKDEVTGQSANRIFSAVEIGHKKSNVLRSMTWGVGDSQSDFAYKNFRAFPKRVCRFHRGIGV